MTNIVLTGFMGTGKTTVGRAVARQLNRPFVDMDDEIVARAGKPIPRIFAEDGEPAFRQIESAVCADLSAQTGLVIATGGGALVNPANRATMQHTGVVVCLDAEPEEILRRVMGGASRRAPTDRPLLNVPDPAGRVADLLAARRDAYAAIPWHVATTGLDVDEVVAQVLALADVITLPVRYPGGSYDIHIGHGLLARLGGALRAAGAREGTAVAVVTNTVVGPLYAAQVEATLRRTGYRAFVCTIPDGEQHKTLDTVRALYDAFLDHHFDRSGTVLALGGGVTGDIAGFAAATFMRGTRFVQVPTSLLAMTDASVGGKTGVDLPQGKNLVGAFKQPALVLIDLDVLATLPEAEFRSGMAEVVKHGVIGGSGEWRVESGEWRREKGEGEEGREKREWRMENGEGRRGNREGRREKGEGQLATRNSQLTTRNSQLATRNSPFATRNSQLATRNSQLATRYSQLAIRNSQLARSIRVKIGIVEEDPFEEGRRAVLNLGHTTAHGLERVSEFTLRHGEAVSIGMVAAARIAEALGRAEPGLAARIAAALAAWGLPVTCPPYPVDAIWDAMTHDKKRRGKSLRWVLPRAIGEVEVVEDVPEEVVKGVLGRMGNGE